ncbi:MAG: glycosyltransferase family A protein [Corynebacterium sp.]|nr:glycosyltransferase family A protein [Corynebacterium sp.]
MSITRALRSAYITADRRRPRRYPNLLPLSPTAPAHPDVSIAVIGSPLTKASLAREFPLVKLTSGHLAAVIVEDGYEHTVDSLPNGFPVFRLSPPSTYAPNRYDYPDDPFTLLPFVDPALAHPRSAYQRRHHSVALLDVDDEEALTGAERLADEQRYHAVRYAVRPSQRRSPLTVPTPQLGKLLGSIASTEVVLADPLWVPTCFGLGTFAIDVAPARTPATDGEDPDASEITADETYARVRMFSESPQFRERLIAQRQRTLWHSATAAHRANHIVSTLNIPWRPAADPMISVICSTNKPDQLAHLLSQFGQQTYPNRELIVATHGFTVTEEEQHGLLGHTAGSLGTEIPVRFIAAPSEWTLGQCLNMLVGNGQGEVIAKFDDDDFYLPNYLTDQVKALQITGADVVGKATCYYFVESFNAIARRRPGEEHHYGTYVKGSTLMARMELFHQFPFPAQSIGEDTQFLKDVHRAGKMIYSTDRFNYLAVRAEPGAHTWHIDDAQLLVNATVETFGLNLRHVEA